MSLQCYRPAHLEGSVFHTEFLPWDDVEAPSQGDFNGRVEPLGPSKDLSGPQRQLHCFFSLFPSNQGLI